ncbi:MAG: MFS transporter, partial [Gemmatimonadetes bacterium]|nr:MFS transporter [Gemmatimonadota bacterium]
RAARKGDRCWYALQRQAQLTAWMRVAGTAGALSVTVPVARLLPAIGWRGVFWLAAALLLLSSAAIFAFVPRDEERASAAAAPARAFDDAGGYAEVFGNAYFWRFGVASVLAHSTFIALQSLWAGPWFVQVLGMGTGESARALFAFNLTLMLGFFALGWAMPRMERRGWSYVRISAAGLSTYLLLQLAIALARGPWAWTLWLALALAATFFTVMQTHVSLSFRAALTGRAYTAYNLIVFGAIFVN